MKKIYTITLYLLWVSSILAAPVDEQTAKKIAVNWFNQTAGEMRYTLASISDVYYKFDGQDVVLYFISIGKEGFIVIPADDNVRPVLGWTTQNPYAPEFIPPQLDYLLGIYAEAVKKGVDYGDKEIDIANEWILLSVEPQEYILREQRRSVGPLLTSLWGQRWPFNQFCPADPDAPDIYNGHVKAGCVAIAMAQIMYYWKFPNTGVGEHGYDSNYGYLQANFGATNYMWSQMNDDNTGTEAAALLIYHCGIAVEMDYGPNGSYAEMWDVDDALKDFFNYSYQIDFKTRFGSIYSNWVGMLKQQLIWLQPILYGGLDILSASGHAWVIDGFIGEDVFHHNWGHGSESSNGWWTLDDVPDFPSFQGAVVDIYPNFPPTYIELYEENTVGTYIAMQSIEMRPGFSTGLSLFKAEIYEFNKLAKVHIFLDDNPIIEFLFEVGMTPGYNEVLKHLEENDIKLEEDGLYHYEIFIDDELISKGTLKTN